MSSAISGMAASIRAATESETFDLAGHSQSNITATITSAFTDPFPVSEMIRITFVTGAGKLARQKYDENAARAVTSALRDLGYEDDRGASAVLECGGSFKLQHDTGKNLKTVVVFPKISGSRALNNAMGNMTLDHKKGPTLIPEGTPEHMIAMSSFNVFGRMLHSKCPSWAQKKGCLEAILEIKALLESMDAKLLNGALITDIEQDLYDAVSLDSLTQKEALVKKETQAQVEAPNLTKLERSTLCAQVSEKIDILKGEILEAKEENKIKKVEKLTAQLERAIAREKMLEEIVPSTPHPLKNEPEITKLRAEMRPLLKLEAETKGRLLSLKETTTLARKTEIEDEIKQLEESSRGWFESDEAFQARVEESREAAKAREKKKAAKKAPVSAPGYKPKPVTNWATTPGIVKKKPATAATGSRKVAGGGGMFAAMMDSDSD